MESLIYSFRYSVGILSGRKGLFSLSIRGPRDGKHGTYQMTGEQLDQLIASAHAAKREMRRFLKNGEPQGMHRTGERDDCLVCNPPAKDITLNITVSTK